MITLGDKDYPIEFNSNSIGSASKESGINPFSEDASSPLFVRALAFYGIKEAYRIEGRNFDLDIEKIGEMLGVAEMLDMLKLFHDTLPTNGKEPGKSKTR